MEEKVPPKSTPVGDSGDYSPRRRYAGRPSLPLRGKEGWESSLIPLSTVGEEKVDDQVRLNNHRV